MAEISYGESLEGSMFGIPAEFGPELLTYRAALDNDEPAPRVIAHGKIVRWVNSDGVVHYQISTERAAMQADDMQRAVYLIDDGAAVSACYVCAHHNGGPSPLYPEGCEPFVMLAPFPLSVGTRPDNGQPVDMSGWMLGPRRAYHLKISL
jgi:hypothetical protein